MRAYKEVVACAVRTMFDRYMGGSNDYYTVPGAALVAFAYKKTERQFNADVGDAWERYMTAYYDRRNQTFLGA